MKKMYYVTLLSNIKFCYNKYDNSFNKFEKSKFKDKFFLLNKDEIYIGVDKYQKIILRDNQKDKIVIVETLNNLELFKDHDSKLGQYIKKDKIIVNNFFIENLNKPISVEEIMSLSYKIDNISNKFIDLKPRSFSFLPVGKGCQAKCSFCFSESSISTDFKGINNDLIDLDKMARKAKDRGAERAVITGGGEPTLIPHDLLLNSLKILKKYYKKIILITNGYNYSNLKESELIKKINDLIDNGLTVLNISRHHFNQDVNKSIMMLEIKSERIAKIVKKNNLKIKIRFTCVLQKNGIKNALDILNYIKFAKENNITEVCFKELYVSSSVESIYHNSESNKFSRRNHVPLNMLTETLEKNGYFKLGELPWGSPVYSDGSIKIEAYTEPSVGWELSNQIARSWNYMSDGKTYASLEDKNSLI